VDTTEQILYIQSKKVEEELKPTSAKSKKSAVSREKRNACQGKSTASKSSDVSSSRDAENPKRRVPGRDSLL